MYFIMAPEESVARYRKIWNNFLKERGNANADHEFIIEKLCICITYDVQSRGAVQY